MIVPTEAPMKLINKLKIYRMEYISLRNDAAKRQMVKLGKIKRTSARYLQWHEFDEELFDDNFIGISLILFNRNRSSQIDLMVILFIIANFIKKKSICLKMKTETLDTN